MTEQFVGAIDQGTTGTRFVLFDRAGVIRANTYARHEQLYPNPGWVEHDPGEIWANVKRVVREGFEEAGVDGDDLAALGVANQRETTVLWNAETGEPVTNAIVWQDRRTTDRVEAISEATAVDIREQTGLEPDAYFSATKAEWLLDEGDRRERAAAGELLLGTVDAWLLWNLTGVHATDVTNAARTMLFDVHDLAFAPDLLDQFSVPEACLPEVYPSVPEKPYGHTDPEGVLGARVPVAGVLGDQQAALFGQTCFEAGEVKNTCGTGSFVLLNTGDRFIESDRGLVTTVAFQVAGEPPRYALEGSVFTTGAAVEWLGDLLGATPGEVEALARRVDDTDEVYLVPAFQGLGAPFWDGRARGTIVGLTRSTERSHLARAALEAVAFRTRDVVRAMAADAGLSVDRLRVDGGAVGNDLLCTMWAEVLETTVDRPVVEETTALGAAFAAGLATGYWPDRDTLRATTRVDRTFVPEDLDGRSLAGRADRWAGAVERSRDWARGA